MFILIGFDNLVTQDYSISSWVFYIYRCTEWLRSTRGQEMIKMLMFGPSCTAVAPFVPHGGVFFRPDKHDLYSKGV